MVRTNRTNSQAFTRAVECAEEFRPEFGGLGWFDSGYCIDAPEWLPAGAAISYAFYATFREGV